MKKTYLQIIMALVLVFTLIGSVSAELIVDTGTPFEVGSNLLGDQKWFAARFDLDQDYTITEIQGHMFNFGSTGDVTFVLYGNSDNLPDLDNEITSGTVNVGTTADWYGLSGLNESLSAGQYWAAFEVRDKNTFYGRMFTGAPDPLPLEAVNEGSGYFIQSTDIGVRVYAEDAAVPVPAAVWLLGSGLLGLAGLRRGFLK